MEDLLDIFNTKEFTDSPYQSPIIIGRTQEQQLLIKNFPELHHILITGSSGSGKSSFLHWIALNFIRKSFDSAEKLIIIDTNGLEFSPYDGIPQLLIPIIKDSSKCLARLNWIMAEITSRYHILLDHNTRNFEDYNDQVSKDGLKPLPRIVIIVDEIYEIYHFNRNIIKETLSYITLKGSTVGIHMIVSTQDLSIAKSIRNLFPTDIKLDKIENNHTVSLNSPFQGNEININMIYIKWEEVLSILSKLKPAVDVNSLSPTELINSNEPTIQNDEDDLLEEAIETVIKSGQASTSMLQRRFRIGYNRATRIIDIMENKGIISEADGSRPRRVLIADDNTKERANEIHETSKTPNTDESSVTINIASEDESLICMLKRLFREKKI